MFNLILILGFADIYIKITTCLPTMLETDSVARVEMLKDQKQGKILRLPLEYCLQNFKTFSREACKIISEILMPLTGYLQTNFFRVWRNSRNRLNNCSMRGNLKKSFAI